MLFFLAQTVSMNIINGSLKFLASGSYAIIYIYANELFPTNVRNTGMGICSMVARIGAIIGTFFNDYLVSFCEIRSKRCVEV
jgi:MFS family permease